MARTYRSSLRNLSPHGFYAVIVILISQVVPAISMVPVHSLYEKVRNRIGSAVIVKSSPQSPKAEAANWTSSSAPSQMTTALKNPVVNP
jgi:hypothetical protein